MPNIATVLKDEITRLARKEIRLETTNLKKLSATYRSDIAELKRQIKALEGQVRLSAKIRPAASAVKEGEEVPLSVRFGAKSFASQRKRLGLSAAELGILLNCSGQSIYKWEQGMARPRAASMPAIIALRNFSKSQAAGVLASR